jgi:hypothetical protein
MKKVHLLIALIVLVSCNSSKNTIIPYDYEANFPDTKNGLTQEQAYEYNKTAMNQIQLNTVGKKLPKIFIYDINNKKVRLNKLIKETTLIYATDNHCGWGLQVLDTDLPYTLEKLKADSIYLNAIALLVRYPVDSTDAEDFNKKAAEVNSLYDQFYIIDNQEAKKFNSLNATKLLVDRKGTVLYIGYGANADPDRFYEQLKSKLMITNIQPNKTSLLHDTMNYDGYEGYIQTTKDSLQSVLARVCSGISYEFVDLYQVTESIADTDLIAIDDYLKDEGFEVIEAGRGNWTKGPRICSMTLRKDSCYCRIDKLYYSTKNSKKFKVTERITTLKNY